MSISRRLLTAGLAAALLSVVGTGSAQQSKKKPVVVLDTTLGVIQLELNAEKAPITVKNFLDYVEKGHYNGTVFHRVIPDFMIQGGGMTPDMEEKTTRAPIRNEASNGLKNLRGTIAMARTSDPDSATAQFFINVSHNESLNYTPDNPGYAVFGKVTMGMDVVDKIVVAKVTTKGVHANVPVTPIIIKSAKVQK
jgi:cyclophilin family peptidyl-prolyl cis-trans isomerase